MSTLATWDKILGALGSTGTSFGGEWGNLISDFFNGINIALADPTKLPRINTLTRYKFEKLGLFDGDESHEVLFSVDDIDTGPNRKIKIRRMDTPFESDYIVMEGMSQPILNKQIDSDLNTITNIVDTNIKASASISYSKLNLTNSIVNTDVNGSAGIVYSKLVLTDSIVATDLTTDSVINTKIQNGAVTLDKMAANSVDSSKIVADTIVNSDINTSAAIDWTKINKTGSTLHDLDDVTITSVASQNLIMRNGSNQWVNLSVGSNNTALTVDSGSLVYSQITSAHIANDTIVNADINTSAAIETTKLADSTNFILKTLDNNFGAHYYDMTRITAPANPAANDARIFIQQVDTNNDAAYIHIKKNGSFQKVFVA